MKDRTAYKIMTSSISHSSLVFHKGNEASETLPQESGNQSSFVSGRFLESGLSSSNFFPDRQDNFSTSVTGVQNKLGEVLPNSLPKNSLLGDNFRFRRAHAHLARGKDKENKFICPSGSELNLSLKKRPRKDHRVLKFCSRLSSSRKALSKAPDSLVKQFYHSSSQRSACSSGPGFKGGSPSLGRYSSSLKSSSHASSRTYSRDNDGRFRIWLERGTPPPPGKWYMGRGSKRSFYELERIKNNSKGSGKVCGLLPRAMRKALVRQHYSLGLPKPSGFVAFSAPLEPDKRDFGVLSGERDFLIASPHSRESKCTGRQSFKRYSNLYGVVFGRVIFCLGLQRVGSSSRNRSFCNERECAVAFIHLSLPGRGGLLSGRIPFRLEQLERNLSIPSNSMSGESGGETVVLPRYRNPDSSPLVLPSMVSPSRTEVQEENSSSSESLHTPRDLQGQSNFPPDEILEPIRLDDINNSLIKQGYSADAREYILSKHKDSTDNRYQSAWSKFVTFVREKKINLKNLLVRDVIIFLCYHAK